MQFGKMYQSLALMITAVLWDSVGAAASTERIPTFGEWVSFGYEVSANETYLTMNNQPLKLDVFSPNNLNHANPVVMFIHGGGWVYNTKENVVLRVMPFLEKGFSVVNIDYRGIDSAFAPAAVIDDRCALNWVRTHAEEYHFDLKRIVLSGSSAGGHLSLMTAFATDTGGFDRVCWDGSGPKVAAVVNWYGISDVADLLDGPHIHSYAVQWIGHVDDPMKLARSVSPLTYLRKDLPPVISIHGDADTVVPYTQATRLHEALSKLGVVNELVTIPGKGHGNFTPLEVAKCYDAVWKFLGSNNLMPERGIRDSAKKGP